VKLRPAAIIGWILILPAIAQASDDSGRSPTETLYYLAGNLALLVSVIIYCSRKPVQAFFASRRNEIKTELEGAASQLSDAEATYAKWQRRLAELESELEEIRTTARQRAEAERERILSDARASAERIRRDGTAAVKLELRHAREELRKEATQAAIDLAAERLEREITDADQDRLVDEFIDRVAAAPNAGADQAGGA
jgi:F-type H+-transporting ATPase subunit b